MKKGTENIGNRSRARIVKNKVSAPFSVAEFDIMFGQGISREADIVDLGVTEEVLTKSGSFYSYGDVRLGQGREQVKEYLKENQDICEDIENKIRESRKAKSSV